MSITDFLARLGHYPKRSKGDEHMYQSMIRDSDSTPSFSVNEKMGAWYDHGMGQGGNVLDLAKRYWPARTFGEVVNKIQHTCNLSLTEIALNKARAPRPRIKAAVKVPNYQIQAIKPFGSSEGINTYLHSRGLFEIAADRIREVHYYVEDEKKNRKNYFAAGWQNELGGWEVRNKYFKGCLGKKAVTFLPEDPDFISNSSDQQFNNSTTHPLNNSDVHGTGNDFI